MPSKADLVQRIVLSGCVYVAALALMGELDFGGEGLGLPFLVIWALQSALDAALFLRRARTSR
jgi:hypothetical protein